jgi:hypothetical protein
MSERTWNVILWVGMLGAVGAVIATISSYVTIKDTSYAVIFFIIAILFAIMAAVANIGATRVRASRWSGEMATHQQRVDDLFAEAQSGAKHYGPEARAMAAEADSEGETLAEEEGERGERVEHGNWE